MTPRSARSPGWVDHAIFWQVYPLGFVGAETSQVPAGAAPMHRLARIVDWLDYLVDLGANGLLLGPVFTSSSHGYDTIDYLTIDPRLGDVADFDHLVREAKARGIRVLLDGVFNHVGRDHPAFRAALEEGPGGPYAEWFHLYWPPDGRGQPTYEHFEGHESLVTLNHGNPEVKALVGDVMTYWLDRGVDGWRLDAAYAVPVDFWAAVLPQVRAKHPDAYFVGEVIHGDYPSFVTQGGLDSVTQYELWKALWSSLNDANFHELAWTITRHEEFLESFVPLTFVGNHDVTRITARLTDARHFPHAVVALMTLGGTPSIYYGDEQGMRAIKEDRVGGDEAVRPEFPGSPADLPADGWDTFRLHQRLIGVRRRHAWLACARTTVEHVTNTWIAWRSESDDRALVIALSCDDASVSVPVPEASGILEGAGELSGSGDDAVITLAPHGWAILRT